MSEVQPVETSLLEISHLPLGNLLILLGGESLCQPVTAAAEIQAKLMVANDILRKSFSPAEGAETDAVKARANQLFDLLGKDFEARYAALQNPPYDQDWAFERFCEYRCIVDSRRGMSGVHQIVPPIGAILANRKLGLVDDTLVDGMLLTQLGLRLAMVALESASEIHYVAPRSGPKDSEILKAATRWLENGLNFLKGEMAVEFPRVALQHAFAYMQEGENQIHRTGYAAMAAAVHDLHQRIEDRRQAVALRPAPPKAGGALPNRDR